MKSVWRHFNKVGLFVIICGLYLNGGIYEIAPYSLDVLNASQGLDALFVLPDSVKVDENLQTTRIPPLISVSVVCLSEVKECTQAWSALENLSGFLRFISSMIAVHITDFSTSLKSRSCTGFPNLSTADFNACIPKRDLPPSLPSHSTPLNFKLVYIIDSSSAPSTVSVDLDTVLSTDPSGSGWITFLIESLFGPGSSILHRNYGDPLPDTLLLFALQQHQKLVVSELKRLSNLLKTQPRVALPDQVKQRLSDLRKIIQGWDSRQPLDDQCRLWRDAAALTLETVNDPELGEEHSVPFTFEFAASVYLPLTLPFLLAWRRSRD